jgi:membrane protein implicated in regulation of membrane protease activity
MLITHDFIWVAWFVIGLVLLIVEIFSAGFVVSLIGLACFMAGIVSIFTDNLIIQFVVFAITMILLMIYVRPIIKKLFSSKSNKKSNIDLLIGKVCVVDTEINNLKGTGYIKINADYWKAVSSDGSNIPKGTIVVIEKMEGITVTVSLKKD